MKLKPRKTTLEPRASLYKRYTDISHMVGVQDLYKTTDNKYWVYDKETSSFMEYEIPTGSTRTIHNVSASDRLKYYDKIWQYTTNTGWTNPTVTPATTIPMIFTNMGKYQRNAYYFFGTFSYMKDSNIESTTGSLIKGNITPMESFSIKHYNDDIDLQPDDLVILDGKLYAIESVEVDHKHLPRDFKVYSAVVNAIL